MKNTVYVAAASLMAGSASAQPAALEVTVKGIEDGAMIPSRFAYCEPDGNGKSKPAANINPEISWSGAPAGTKSYAILVVDSEVPTSFERANQDGKIIPEDFPRQDFYHWVLTDIPLSTTSIAEGQDSNGTPQGGKSVGKTAYGINRQNDFASIYPGNFGGYDGPCPPWNDERIHHYHYTVYALGVESLHLPEGVSGRDVRAAVMPHILAKGSVSGSYSQNKALLK